MSTDEAQRQADILRSEAKALLNVAIGGHGAVDRLVDCIISCAILEIAICNASAAKEVAK